ncbi:MAG: sugar transferase, partial [Candidatus Eiseniibacteriota bacterium]
MMILPSELLSKQGRERRAPNGQAVLKRTLDVVVSGAALIVLAPVVALLAVLIKLDSPGPVFYIQERIGINRRRSRNGGPPDGKCRRISDTFG